MNITLDHKGENVVTTVYIGKVEVGTTKEIEIFLDNPTGATIENIKILIPKIEGLTIEDIPTTIEPWGNKPIRIIWKPSLKFEKALDIEITVKATAVYYAEKSV